MKHFYHTIHGWFSFQNLYKSAVVRFGDNSHFVEVGTWLGKSAAYMAVEILNSNKKIQFDCIDTWEGSVEHKNLEIIKDKKLYETFLNNIDPVKNVVNPIRKSSLEAVDQYADDSLDFVFIDASHVYEDVKRDINVWYPKVKKGGLLAGHDYKSVWSDVDMAVNEFINAYNYTLESDINGQEKCWGFIKK